MRWAPASIAVIAVTLVLAGCASAGSGSAGGPPPPSGSAASPPAAGPSASALPAPPSATASPPPCTTHACIVADAKSLVGGVAKDNSVMTALTCYSSTVKNPDPGIYTVSCLATYSDGGQWDGIASVLLAQNQVEWEATEEVQ